jgi:hypothetical protein
MLSLYLFSLFTILLTEYGFQSRKRALQGFKPRWRWRRTLYRALIWILVLVIGGWGKPLPSLLLVVGIFLLIELGVYGLRAGIRRDMRLGRTFAAPWTHALPFVLTLAYPVLLLLGRGLAGGFTVLHAALPREQAVLFGVAFLSLWTWATMVTVSVVQIVRPEQLEAEISPSVGAGELIGILERLITFTLLAAGGLAAVGFVIAVKAAVRFPLFRDKEFAEYFLIGTLCSVGLAVLAALPLIFR